MDAPSLSILGVAALIAGGIASIAGFGIGSVLTPTLSIWIDARLAVAAISIPHLIGTAWRFWLLHPTTHKTRRGDPGLKGRVDRRVLWSFGIPSAAGGIAGAVLNTVVTSPALLMLLALLLLFVAAGELTGFSRRLVLRGPLAWVAGALSGALGGLVGNQGGLRSAALLGFRMDRDTFVATATAIGLIVDAARMPVYFAVYARELGTMITPILVATVGVVIGTVVGGRILRRIPEPHFRRVVAVFLAVLGIWLLTRV
jgi:uncharacterized membrane protein YfcA